MKKQAFRAWEKAASFSVLDFFLDKNAQLGKDAVSKLFDQHNTALWDTYHLALMF